MIAVIQRVSEAEVSAQNETIGKIGRGVLILLGVARGDGEREVKYLCEKTANLRIFDNSDGKPDLSLLEIKGEALVVSQFTLLGNWRKGRRLSYDNAAPPKEAEPLVKRFRETLESMGVPVQTGRFGAKMSVRLVNEGPMTITIDTSAL